MSTLYLVPGYEQASGGAVTKHFSFGGRPVALRNPGGVLSFHYEDAVNSTVYFTDAYADEPMAATPLSP